MTLEIHNSGNGSVTEYFVYADKRPLSTPKPSMRPQLWSDDEIAALLGNKYDSFEQGRFLFNHFPAWKVKLIRGQQAATTREQLLFISQFQS